MRPIKELKAELINNLADYEAETNRRERNERVVSWVVVVAIFSLFSMLAGMAMGGPIGTTTYEKPTFEAWTGRTIVQQREGYVLVVVKREAFKVWGATLDKDAWKPRTPASVFRYDDALYVVPEGNRGGTEFAWRLGRGGITGIAHYWPTDLFEKAGWWRELFEFAAADADADCNISGGIGAIGCSQSGCRASYPCSVSCAPGHHACCGCSFSSGVGGCRCHANGHGSSDDPDDDDDIDIDDLP